MYDILLPQDINSLKIYLIRALAGIKRLKTCT